MLRKSWAGGMQCLCLKASWKAEGFCLPETQKRPLALWDQCFQSPPWIQGEWDIRDTVSDIQAFQDDLVKAHLYNNSCCLSFGSSSKCKTAKNKESLQQQQKDSVTSPQLSHNRQEQEQVLLDNCLNFILHSLTQTIQTWELSPQTHLVAI